MPSKISTLCELLGLVGVALAVGNLAGFWLGVLAGALMLIVVGYALGDDGVLPPGER